MPDHSTDPTDAASVAIAALIRDGERGRPASSAARHVEIPPIDAPDLSSIAHESSANARTTSIGSLAGGQLRVVGFATAAGYLQAIKNGVPRRTHAIYVQTLITRFNMTEKDVSALPGPMVQVDLPSGPGIIHQPRGVPLFDRPRSERRFLVGEARAAAATAPPRPPRQQLMRVMAGSAPVRRASPPPSSSRPGQPQPSPPQPSPPQPSPVHQTSASAARPSPVVNVTPGRDLAGHADAGPQDDAAARFSLLEFD